MPPIQLVDPLAALFRTDLREAPVLVLDATEVEIFMLPPLACVVTTRHFTNRENAPVEALLTLPPVSDGEVIFGLAIAIDGETLQTAGAASGDARDDYDTAITSGRRSVVLEVTETGVPILSIANIPPHAKVSVRIESIRPLMPEQDGASARLNLALSADPAHVNPLVDHSMALRTTMDRHPATLTVRGIDLAVSFAGNGQSLQDGNSVAIDCAAPVRLLIAPLGTRTLNRTLAEIVGESGWEARLDDRFNPTPDAATVDQITGSWWQGEHVFRVIAPRPDPSPRPVSLARRAVTAFAIANPPSPSAAREYAALRVPAGIVSADTSLFAQSDAAPATDAWAATRRLALPAVPTPGKMQPTPQASRARPPDFTALDYAPLAIILAGIIYELVDFGTILPGPVMLLAVVLAIFNARRLWSRTIETERRRMRWLFVLCVPAIGMVLGLIIPNVLIGSAEDASEITARTQIAMLLLAALLPAILVFLMRDLRRLVINISIIAFAATCLVFASSFLLMMTVD